MKSLGCCAEQIAATDSSANANPTCFIVYTSCAGGRHETGRKGRRPGWWTRPITAVALTFALALALGSIVKGVEAFNGPRLSPGGVPFRTIGVVSFIIATVLLLAAAGDLRVLRSGTPRRGQRLARHLWRMCFALFIAAGSFFSIREPVATILPEPFTTGPMRALPILLLFRAMFYWLWRVRRPRTLRVPVREDSMPLATRPR